MKIYLLIFLALFIPEMAFAQTEFEGDISGEWDADGSPYVQIGEANIPENESLNILPGVEVIIGEDMTLTCNGLLTAIGTEEDTIRIHGPEGLISGQLRLYFQEDTSRFEYCRFDSLLRGVWGQDCPVLVESSLFFDNAQSLRFDGGWVYCNSNFFYSDRDAARGMMRFEAGNDPGNYIVENNVSNWPDFTFRDADNIVCVNNTGLRRGGNHYPSIDVFSSENMLISDNESLNLFINNQGRRLESAIVENNRLEIAYIGYNSNWGAILRNNYIDETMNISHAYAVVTGNEINEEARFSTDATAIFENNLVYRIRINDGCELEFSNNTLIFEGFGFDYSPINSRGADNNLTLRNNIIVSHSEVEYAVSRGIRVIDGGYNLIFGPDEAYASRGGLLRGDIVEDPRFVGGHPAEYYLQANSPCIDAGDPDSPEDPDGTRADIGLYYYDQENGMPPAIISEYDMYTGWGMQFRYVARATDMEGAIEFEFEGLPEWLEVEDEGRDFVSDSVTISGVTAEDQETFVFIIHAFDEDDMEDTLSVQVFVYPFTVLTGQIGGVLGTENSPYLVADTAWVAEGDSLIVEPGCEVIFDAVPWENRDRAMLIVEGYLRAVGNAEDSIIFRPSEDVSNRRHLRLYPNNNGLSEIRYCNLQISISGNEHSIIMTNCTAIPSGSYLFRNNNRESLFADNVIINGKINFVGPGRVTGNNIFYNSESNITVKGGEEDTIIVDHNILTGMNDGINLGYVGLGIARNNVIDITSGEGIDVRATSDFSNSYIITNNLSARGNRGIRISNWGLNANIANNIIWENSWDGILIYYLNQDSVVISNNVVSGSRTALHIRSMDEGDYEHLTISNNLFISDSILFRGDNPEFDWEGFVHNSIFDVDTIGVDLGYIGELTQVNVNGDSVDAGFNLFLDPHLVNLDSLDFHLFEDSPLIDAGSPDSFFFDLDRTVNDIGLYGGPFGESYEYPVGVGESDVPLPEGFTLAPPFPNPFNSMTRFSFTLPSPGDLEIRIYDTIGRLVFTEPLTILQAGDHHYVWRGVNNSGGNLPTGIYYIELTFEGAKLVRRTVMLK